MKRPSPTVIIITVATLVGLILALRDRRVVLYDDAAITFRYADNLAHGHGFTYNPGVRSNGASAPLYTIILAVLHWLGLDLESAAKGIGILAFGATFGLVAYLTRRIAGLAAAVVAVLFLIACIDYRIQALSGMESAFAAMLGLLAIALLLDEHDTLAGVVIGLAIWNKLDAGLLALAIGVAFLIITRRPPWRTTWVALVTVAPWAVFSQLYFGSVIPYSATQKLGPIRVAAPNRDWIIEAFQARHVLLLLILAGCAVVVLPLASPRARIALAACIGWFALHGLAFSLLNLDPYPWYTTVLYPPVAIAAACTIGLLVGTVKKPGRAVLAELGILTIAAGGILSGPGTELQGAAKAVQNGHVMDDYEAFEWTRKAAGSYIARVGPGDVILNCFGWIAYEALDNPIRESCPLATREPTAEPKWFVQVAFPGLTQPQTPAGWELRKVFTSNQGRGGATYVYRIRT